MKTKQLTKQQITEALAKIPAMIQGYKDRNINVPADVYKIQNRLQKQLAKL